MARDAFDPFEALGLPRDASAHAIKARYHALARKYHPNRHPGSDESKSALSEHFYPVHQAWQLLSKADNRRRHVELLKLLDLQNDMLTHFVDLIEAESPTEQHHDQNSADAHGSDLDGHLSSDADDDLPQVGIKRRQTDLKRGAKHLGDSISRPGRVRFSDLASISTSIQEEHPVQADYFSKRRKKLSKLRRKELDAFIIYRNAMISKFEAEEEAEKQYDVFERARWKREYFERAPKETSERMRSFQHFMGAVRAFGAPAIRSRKRSTTNYGLMSPIIGGSESQFLYPEHALARRKSTAHRRGYSSDISGDQSSSDDDSADTSLPRRISPPGRWAHNPVKARESTLAEWNERLQSPHNTRKEPEVPFTFIVKRPTDLNTNASEPHRNSSPDSNSDPSRSPSPQMRLDSYRYTLLPASGTADLFDIVEERRARSPSPSSHRRTVSSPSIYRDAPPQQPAPELCQFITKQIGPPQFRGIQNDCVYLLPYEVKSRLLGAELEFDTDPAVLLERLARLDPHAASKFMVKPDIKESFNFRLIYGHADVRPPDQQSFIALSYRRKLHVDREATHYTLPLDPEVFQAVWDERQSPAEGVWIDQICIDQESDLEKTVSMSAMDMVYRSARLIVVALDDIELEAHEGTILQTHMDEYASMSHVAPRQRFRRKEPPYLETHEDLSRVIAKILHSSWFRRAWCRHEMRLAKSHIFLIPCKSPGSWSGRDVLRFNGKCIDHLLALSTEVPFVLKIETVKPALHAFFRDRSKMTANDKTLRHHHGNFTAVVAEVFDMEAGGDPRVPEEQRRSDARKDMISIVLNTMECGLALDGRMRHPGVHFSLHDCYRDLSLLALAAQDPGALCSVGRPLPSVLVGPASIHAKSSWMYVPTVADSGLNNFKTLQRFPEDASFHTLTDGSSECIELDLLFLRSNREYRPDSHPESFEFARRFMQICDERKWGRNRKRYLTHDRRANELFGPMRDVYIETLACVLQCGPDWMSDVSQRYRMSRWKINLHGAYELLVALQNTNGKWPVAAWSEQAAGFIMDFVNFLVIRGMPQRQLTKPERWRPIYVHTSDTGKILTFVPRDNAMIQPVVPTALANPNYVHLSRLWTLEPRSCSGNDESEWTLLGKSVLFSDEPSIEQMKLQKRGEVREQQKVYGRKHEISNIEVKGATSRSL